MAQTNRAVTLTVDFGFVEVEGLMLPDGSYAIGASQVADLLGIDRNKASRDFARLLGNDFCVSKVASDQGNQRINVMSLDVFKKILFALAQKGNVKAVKIWNQNHPDVPFLATKNRAPVQRIESLMEEYVVEMYREFKPQRQVSTNFGIADVVHDHGVVEVKEFKSIRSAHLAMGQAMSYGAILNKQPEVMLFNIPETEIQRVIAMFTGVGMLVWIYSKEDTKAALARKRYHPTCSNAVDIQFQISRY